MNVYAELKKKAGTLHSFVGNNGMVLGVIKDGDGKFFAEQIEHIHELKEAKDVGDKRADERSVVDGTGGWIRPGPVTSNPGPVEATGVGSTGTKGPKEKLRG